MKNTDKYTRQYFMPPTSCTDWMKKNCVEKAPVWCSVDLRDGNQALVTPMSTKTKLDFFDFLVSVGFKEIEVGFPASSQTEYEFLRALIDERKIPDDVTIQVLTQAREHIINKTFEAVKGAKNVIVHVYNSTSVAQREQVFKRDKDGIKKIAIDGAKQLLSLTPSGANYRFEYSPESFTGTEPEYALDVVNAVLDVWKPKADKKAVINLPATVENAMPHVFAQQVEFIHKNMIYRNGVALSLHTHNDRGCAVAAAELGLLAGADRIEGTLFGNGERTGNADIVTMAMNMYSQGVDPQLDFSDMPDICDKYTLYTGMPVGDRQPYAGKLVFAAFSGSHQDAIAKGMTYREKNDEYVWTVPYLPIDPKDVGRNYDSDVIRINSQSGKGGVGYVLYNSYGLNLPVKMREHFGYLVKGVSDMRHSELSPKEIYEIFEERLLNPRDFFDVVECHFKRTDDIEADVTLLKDGKTSLVSAHGNGRLDAISNALKKALALTYALTDYEEHSLGKGSSSTAISYVGVEADGKTYFGAGEDKDIIVSSYKALVSAVNNMLKEKQ